MFKNVIANLTLIFMRLFSKPLKKKVVVEQYEENKRLWDKEQNKTFIDNQREMSKYKYGYASWLSRKMFFGGRQIDASDNTCEVIATYNAVYATGNMKAEYEFPNLIKMFSQKGIALKGAFGTNPIYVRNILSDDYIIGELKGKDINEKRVSKLDDSFDAFIFSSYNNGYNPFSMLHTMCIEKTKDSKYIIHNDYEGNKSYDSLYNALVGYNSGKGGAVYIMGLKKR